MRRHGAVVSSGVMASAWRAGLERRALRTRGRDGDRDRAALPLLLLVVGIVLFVLLLGFFIGASAWQPVALLIVLPLSFGLIWLGTARPPQGLLRSLLPLGALLLIAAPLLQQLRVPLGYLFELLLFCWLLGAALQARRHMGDDRALRWVIALYALYLVLSLVSSVFGRSQPMAAVWQFQYNLKWFAMFLVGAMLVWDARAERTLAGLLMLLWLPIGAAVALEIAVPGAYQRLFGPFLDFTPHPVIHGLRRVRGPFAHAGYLALTSAAFAWFCVVFALQRRQLRWLAVALPYLVLLALAGQRQEAAGLVLALLALGVIALRRHWVLMLPAGLALAGIDLVVLVMLDRVPGASLLAQWGMGDPLEPLSERAILSARGLDVAAQYFPFGAGLGTYGGAGAQKFDQSLFIDLGFGRYWWFRQGKFLIDVYWPSVAAESGWPAAAALLMCYLVLLFGLLRRWLRGGAADTLLLLALGALLILLSNTPTSAIITDPRGSFVLWLVIGAAWRHSQAWRPTRAAARRPAAAWGLHRPAHAFGGRDG